MGTPIFDSRKEKNEKFYVQVYYLLPRYFRVPGLFSTPVYTYMYAYMNDNSSSIESSRSRDEFTADLGVQNKCDNTELLVSYVEWPSFHFDTRYLSLKTEHSVRRGPHSGSKQTRQISM